MTTGWTILGNIFGFVLDRFRLEKVVGPSEWTPILAGTPALGRQGDTPGGRREVGDEAPKGRASAERMLRATREARCDLPACSDRKGGLRRPQPLGYEIQADSQSF